MTPPRKMAYHVQASQTHWTAGPLFPRSPAGWAHIKRHWLRRKKLLLFIPFDFTLGQKGTWLSAISMAQRQQEPEPGRYPSLSIARQTPSGAISITVGARYTSGAHGHSCVLGKQTFVPPLQELPGWPTANPTTWPQAKLHESWHHQSPTNKKGMEETLAFPRGQMPPRRVER